MLTAMSLMLPVTTLLQTLLLLLIQDARPGKTEPVLLAHPTGTLILITSVNPSLIFARATMLLMDNASPATLDMTSSMEHAYTLLPTLPPPLTLDARLGKMESVLLALKTGHSMPTMFVNPFLTHARPMKDSNALAATMDSS